MNITINQDSTRLVIAQRLGWRIKVVFYSLFLLLFVVLPGYFLARSGTLATLTCAQESGAGVVCTDRTAWLGEVRYERVEGASVRSERLRVDGFDDWGDSDADFLTLPVMYLKTATGNTRLGWLIYGEYVESVGKINAFVQAPGATPLVVRDRLHILGLVLPPVIVLGAIYVGWLIWREAGDKAVFDASDRQVWLYIDQMHSLKSHRIAFDEITSVYTSSDSLERVRIATASATFKLWSLIKPAAPDKSSASETITADRITADAIVETIIHWLAQHGVQLQLPDPAPIAATSGAGDLVEVSHPGLAYLLRHSRNSAVVMRGDRASLDMDGLGVGPVQKQQLRSALAELEYGSRQTRDDLAYQIAPQLLLACRVDVLGACRSANPQQRAAIDELLYPPRER